MSEQQQAWNWLARELDRWGESELSASFWWRDDDAVEPSTALDRLLQLSTQHGLPLALAVIPAGLQSQLVTHLQQFPQVSVLQHGFDHRSHALPGQRKLELGGDRDTDDILIELQQGYRIMHRQFGNRFTPVLVPPWNRIDARLVTRLTSIGLRGISAMRVRRMACPAPGLLQVNTHLDPVNWRQRRGFIGLYPAIAILVQHLIARRTGYRDLQEPTGILSHHLVQSDTVWRFLELLFTFLDKHPAAIWTDATSIWQAPVPEQTGPASGESHD
jgi:hypothetical protein